MGLLSKSFAETIKIVLCVVALSMISCSSEEQSSVKVIPLPAQMEVRNDFYKDGLKNVIREEPIGKLPAEGYQLSVDRLGIVVRASSEAGYFYGEQTLKQLMTPDGIPFVSIQDFPRFPYRGVMLDVSRHFFSKEFVLKLIDALSFYKMNRLHLHLTDAEGWRLQMDQYPELTRLSAFRTHEDLQEWERNGRQFVPEGTPGSYGGYYTKDDMREIVAYAAARHIAIVPEIEMPGHSSEVFASYPELCCAGEPYTDSDYCVGNEETFTFLENVLKEVMEVFPSEYIHVGGDEASKRAWHTCPKCQELMGRERMTHVNELQTYLIRRINKFLNDNGRKLIGWDEILEGKPTQGATVMSWRGEAGGIKGARMGHDVIMAPMSYLYFDFYQAYPPNQPYAIGGYTPVKKVYSYNPVSPDSLTILQGKHVIGVQANLWSEYVPNEDHAEYMLFPRVLALAEVAWSPQKLRDWQDFKFRMSQHLPDLKKRGLNAFPLSDEIDITMEVDTVKKEIRVELDAEKYPTEIRYTTDGTMPTSKSPLYQNVLTVRDSAHIIAAIFKENKIQGEPTEKRVDYHRGINKPITYNSNLFPGYMAGGANALLDGYRGGFTYYDERWQGYTNSLDCVVDMEEVTTINQVSLRFMQLIGPNVFQPGDVEVLLSEDGKNYTSCGVIITTKSNKDSDLSFETYTFAGKWNARYIQVKAREANDGQFIFADEIVIW